MKVQVTAEDAIKERRIHNVAAAVPEDVEWTGRQAGFSGPPSVQIDERR